MKRMIMNGNRRSFESFRTILLITVLAGFYCFPVRQMNAEECKAQVRFYGDTVIVDDSCSPTPQSKCEAVTWVTICQNLAECRAGQHYSGIDASGIPGELYIDLNKDGTLEKISEARSVKDSSGRYRFTFKNVPCYKSRSDYGQRKSAILFNLENMQGYNPMFTRVDTGLDDVNKDPFGNWFIDGSKVGDAFHDKYNGTWFQIKLDNVKLDIADRVFVTEPKHSSCSSTTGDIQDITGQSLPSFLSQLSLKIEGVADGRITLNGTTLTPATSTQVAMLQENSRVSLRMQIMDNRWFWALDANSPSRTLAKTIVVPIVRRDNTYTLGDNICLFRYQNKISLVDEAGNPLPLSFAGQSYLFESENNSPWRIYPNMGQNIYDLIAEFSADYQGNSVPLKIKPAKANISGYLEWNGFVKINKAGKGIKIWSQTESEPIDFKAESKVRIMTDRSLNQPEFKFESNSAETDEADVAHAIKVILSRSYDRQVKVDVVIPAFDANTNNAIPGTDYRTFGSDGRQTLVFDAGETSKIFNVNLKNDAQNDGLKKIRFVLQNPTNGAKLGFIYSHTLAIRDSFVEPVTTEVKGSIQICSYRGVDESDCGLLLTSFSASDFSVQGIPEGDYSFSYDVGEKKYLIKIKKIHTPEGQNIERVISLKSKSGHYAFTGKMIIGAMGNSAHLQFVPEKSSGIRWRPMISTAWQNIIFVEPEHTRSGQEYHSPSKDFLLRILPNNDADLINFPADITKVAVLKDKFGNSLSLVKGDSFGVYKLKLLGSMAESFKKKYGDPDHPFEVELVFNQGSEESKKWSKWSGSFFIDINDNIQMVRGGRSGATEATIGIPSLFYREVLFRPVAWYGSSLPLHLNQASLLLSVSGSSSNDLVRWEAIGGGLYKLIIVGNAEQVPATQDKVLQIVTLTFSLGLKKEYELRVWSTDEQFVEKRNGSFFEIPREEPVQLLLEGINLCVQAEFSETDECRRRSAIAKIIGGISERESTPTSVIFEGEFSFEDNWAFEKYGDGYIEKLNARYFVQTENALEELTYIQLSKSAGGKATWRMEISLAEDDISTEALESLAQRKYEILISDGDHTVKVTEKNRNVRM